MADINIEGCNWNPAGIAGTDQETFVKAHIGIAGLYTHLSAEDKERCIRKAWELSNPKPPAPEKSKSDKGA
jgi:hypothetical protein